VKKLLSVLLSLAVCTAALCLTAAAAEAEASAELPVFTQAWGKVSPWEGKGRNAAEQYWLTKLARK